MIHDFLHTSASANPKHPCLIHGNRIIRYGELESMANSVRDCMRNSGIRKGDKVILLFDNGAEYAALYFGILRAGGVVVPLNPASREEDIKYSALHCAARFVAAADRSISMVLGWWDGSPILTNGPKGERRLPYHEVFGIRGGRGYDREGVDPFDLAMVLYTSGTTGSPKGVMLTHGNLEANVRSILAYLPLRNSDRTLAVLPFCYSYGNSMLLTHMSAGATLVIENGFAFVAKALDTMRREGVTGFSGVPSHYAILIHRSRFLEEEWPALRYLTCAGGALPDSQVRRIRKALPGVSLHLMYGQTEATARLSSLAPDLVDERPGSIGKGIPGVTLRVVDREGMDVHPGEVGEIIARGRNVMLGYLDDPEATAGVLKGGWLHTGDLATVRDGFLHIVGRSKEIIKSGGYRISPYQVEDVLLQHPSVQECAVVGMEDEILGESIVAFVVPSDERPSGIANGSLMAHLREKLPPYMVPARIEQVLTLPKTESGKIRRGELQRSWKSFRANQPAMGDAG